MTSIFVEIGFNTKTKTVESCERQALAICQKKPKVTLDLLKNILEYQNDKMNKELKAIIDKLKVQESLNTKLESELKKQCASNSIEFHIHPTTMAKVTSRIMATIEMARSN